MSVRRTTLQSAAVALIVSLAIVAASFLYIGTPTSTVTSNNSSAASGSSQLAPLAIRLTDPPQVPSHTSSLDLIYSSLDLLVGEPTGTQGQLVTESVTETPSGGLATIDLLKLQNVSQTIAIADLPAGSVLYSVNFTVTGITIDLNDTVSAVSLAAGGSSFEVTIAHPSAFSSGDFALLQLNPVVVDTPSGYQLIPSSVGVMGHGEGPDAVGDRHQLTDSDNSALVSVKGDVSASITALSVADNVTTLTVLVNNSAGVPVKLAGVGLHGNFTVIGSACVTFDGQAPYQPPGNGGSHSGSHMSGFELCMIPMHIDELVFIPVSSASAASDSSSCATGQLALANGPQAMAGFHNLTINPGQCVLLTFQGVLSFGGTNLLLVPSTAPGQVYVLQLIASNGANQLVSCTLPLAAATCTVQILQLDYQDW